jgi:hypothetical protein
MDASMFDFNQLLMLAIERALAPPVFHRRSVLQPMRIVVVDPTVLARTQPNEEVSGRPFVLPRALPPASETSNASANQFRQRAVRGEILSDEQGRLYEKLGRQIRPINQLASGPFGEVIDLVPVAPTAQQAIAPTPEAKPANTMERIKSDSEEKPSPESGVAKTASLQASPQVNGGGYRKLFADPGQWRVVWWGEFKEILAGQLAHPERLRDTYRLPCYVQVIETEHAVAIEELATIYKSENKPVSPLYMLTDELAAKLDLILPLRPAPARGTPRPPNMLLAHERVFRLVAANDPTIDVATLKSKLQSASSTARSPEIKKDTQPATRAAELKDTIPSRFLKEWEFKLSREEATYDMNAKPTLGALIRKAGLQLRFLNSGKQLRKWQTLLAGKSADEQLWEVRPPQGMLTDAFVRHWVERTLELGGYDSRKMIVEWEIFWRRKGF